MKTMVQTFVIEETKELIYDSDKIQEWKEKCEALGLTEQLQLANPDKSPIPFECMNTVSERVYTTLCPAKVNYKKYGRTPIPIEILSLVALSEKEGYFESIEIWYDDKSPDPIAVGRTGLNEWSGKKYLIGRWGDALRPFDELRQMAIQIYKRVESSNLKQKIADMSFKLENIDTNTDRYFNAQVESYDVVGF